MGRIAPVLWLALMLPCGVAAKEKPMSGREMLSTLNRPHPRLILTDAGLARLKRDIARDERLQTYWRRVRGRADAFIGTPPLAYRKRGPRLLTVSREMVKRAYYLGLAWRLTREEKYAKKLLEDTRAACAFQDWNPSHFLDVAEMAHGVGLAYDWLYPSLDEATRREIRRGLIRNGLDPGLAAYDKPMWWVRSEFNWNQVCNGGLIVGALAVADTDPRYAERILPEALASLPRALKTYEPDGAWPEGPSYWYYATRYTVYALAALDSALGRDFGLSERPGLAKAGFFPLYATGPTGRLLNFADAGERSRRAPMPCMLWLAGRYGRPSLAADEWAVLKTQPWRAHPLHLIWGAAARRPRASRTTAPQRDLERLFKGPVPVAVFRSAWDDPHALFVGVKAGYNQVNHGHLDLGTFILEAQGVRWATDLGSDNYNLPGYWDKRPGGRRWRYYRLNSHSHNVLLIGDKDQNPSGTSRVVAFQGGVEEPRVVLDLSPAYAPSARRVLRGVRLVAGRRAVLVQDEVRLAAAADLLWGMTTRAEIEVAGDRATLTRQGHRLRARVLSPQGARFAVESAERPAPEARNRGVSRLVVRLPGRTGEVRIVVLLAPLAQGAAAVAVPTLEPLPRW